MEQRTEFLTPQEAAALLGVSRPTMVKLLAQGRLPYRCLGHHRLIQREDLRRYAARLGRVAEELERAG